MPADAVLLQPAWAAAPLAAVRLADAVVLALLLLFGLWGMRRGALRQFLSIVVLVGAAAAAAWLAPHAEGTVAKVTSLEGEEREAAAWIAVLFAALVVGGVLLSFLCCRLPDRAEGRANRLLGALLGGAKGAMILLVVSYVLASVGSGERPPALSRTAEPAPKPAEGSAWIGRLRGSLSAEAMTAGAALMTRWVELPAWIDARREGVDAALAGETEAGSPAGRRPRDR